MSRFLPLFIVAAGLLAACAGGSPDVSETASAVPDMPLTISATAVTEPVTQGSFADAAFWRDPESGEWYVAGAADTGGLGMYRRDGTLAASLDSVEAGLLVTVPDAMLGDERRPLIFAYDAKTAAVQAYDYDPGHPGEPGASAFRPVLADALQVGDEITGLCHYRSRLSGADYLYAVTDAGLVEHFELYAVEDGIAGRLLRTIPSGKGSGFCAVDPRDGSLYVAEESTGVWRIGAEAEDDTTREPVDLREPFGGLSDDIKGIAVHPVDRDLAYLLVADLGNEHIAVYALPEGKPLGSFSVDGLSEPEGLALSGTGAGALLAIADEDPSDGGSDIMLVEVASVTAALGLRTATGLPDAEGPVVVRPVVETEVMPTFGDSADDPAIWVHPEDATRSLIIGTGKKSGLYVYDLDGRLLQALEDGRMNNVDVRNGFPLGGKSVPLVTASNRSNSSIAVYRIDVESGELIETADGVLPTGFVDPYGLCMYHSPRSGDFFVFVNESGSGLVRQWRLFDNGEGRVAAAAVRDIPVGSQAEGCVADDEHAILYVAEEDVGLWKYSAEPDGGDSRTAIDAVGDAGRLTDDVEGIALYDAGDGNGFLVVSNQGADNYALYRREGDNEFVGIFHIVANAAAGIDGASETDGLDVSSAALGDAFPDGLLVVQDGRNIAPEERQNFKYVSWRDLEFGVGPRK